MANYRAVATGNWSAGATWGGGAVPPDAAGHNIYSNGFTVTIDQSVDVALITNAAITATFVGGGTSAAVGGVFNLSNGVTVVANISKGTSTNAIATSGTVSASIVGSILPMTVASVTGSTYVLIHGSSGTLTITGNVSGGNFAGIGNSGLQNSGSGVVNIIGNVTAGTGGNGNSSFNSHGIVNSGILNITGNVSGMPSSTQNGNIGIISTGSISIVGSITAGIPINASFPAYGVSASGTSLTIVGDIVALNQNPAVNSSANTTTISGSFISSVNGTTPISCLRYRVSPTPLNARTRYSANGVGAYVDMFTADNSTALNQAPPTDVRSGVVYGISNSQTGRLTVPARGSVALSVNYGPSMPFTATRSGTTATATLAYSYPLVVGDSITVTGASNSEWNSSYTIASVVSGTSVTFVVPNTHSATAGTGATMQTTGTAVLDPAAVASAVWGAASRTITGGTVDTLTNAPASVTPSDIWSHAARTLTSASGPSATDIRQELDTNSTKLANLDATISSRLASSVSTNITAIKAKTDLLNTDRLAQCATTSIVGNLIAQSNS